MPVDALRRLQAWYLSQCDGDWEHHLGVQIETLDNPGWRVSIDLEGTSLEGEPFEERRLERTDADWVHCRVEGKRFEAACGPENLEELLSAFLDWSDGAP